MNTAARLRIARGVDVGSGGCGGFGVGRGPGWGCISRRGGNPHDIGDSTPLATFSYVAREAGKRKLAFICARESLRARIALDRS